MALNIATITPAVLKAKEVATEDYVDTAVSNMTISDATWQAKVQEAVNNNATTIDGSHIVTGSIAADKIAANTISTNQIAVGTGIVNGYVQSSDFTGIGGPGFRLKSNAAGTSADPSIYGAYIKGTTVEGAKFIGALSQTCSFNGDVNGLSQSTTLTHIKTITMDAPRNGDHKLLVVANLAPIGGNWPIVVYDVRVNGVSIIGPQRTLGGGLGSGGIYSRTLIAGPYSSAINIDIYGYQQSAGAANPHSGTNVNISAIGVA